MLNWLNHFMCTKSLQLCPTLQCYGPHPARLLSPWDSPGKNTGVGYHDLLQGILTQFDSLVILLRSILYMYTKKFWYSMKEEKPQ